MFSLFRHHKKDPYINGCNFAISSEWENKLETQEPKYSRTFLFEDQAKVYEFLFGVIQIHSDLFFISACCNKETNSVCVSILSKTFTPVPVACYKETCLDIDKMFEHTVSHDPRHL